MTTKKTKDIVKAHFDALFASDDRVEVEELKRGKTPQLPVKEDALDGKAKVWLQYPPTQERARGLSGNVVPWDEIGAFMVHVVVASQSKAAADLADEVGKTIRDSLRNRTIGEDMDIMDFYGTDLAASWGGSVSGESFAVEFETQSV